MKWFDFDEFERSETAAKRGIVNRMGEKERANVKRLVDDVLDPLRELAFVDYAGVCHEVRQVWAKHILPRNWLNMYICISKHN